MAGWLRHPFFGQGQRFEAWVVATCHSRSFVDPSSLASGESRDLQDFLHAKSETDLQLPTGSTA